MLLENEAPAGYKAVLKSEYSKYHMNFCEFCDWRKSCQDPNVPKDIPKHRCMSFPVILFKNGKELARKDGCSVLFKKIIEPIQKGLFNE